MMIQTITRPNNGEIYLIVDTTVTLLLRCFGRGYAAW